MELADKKVLLAVTGSIAAYKACDLVQRLREEGARVRVVLTSDAAKIITPTVLAALTGEPVPLDAWEGVDSGRMDHIELARWADLFLIAPATANTLGQMALGLTGNLVSTLYLAYEGSIYVAPAMNSVMLRAPAVQANLETLRRRGVHILPSASGTLACGEVGEGKLLEPDRIVDYVRSGLAFREPMPRLDGKNILLTLGHTREKIDGVRFLSNHSSGRTGQAIARALQLAGAQVTAVMGYADVPPLPGMKTLRVGTSAEFRDALGREQGHQDAIIMAAAIADFVPKRTWEGKLKRSKELQSLDLEPSVDILEEVCARRAAGRSALNSGQIVVGFALESGQPLETGLKKLRAKGCDLAVVNDPLVSGFGAQPVPAAIVDLHADGTAPPRDLKPMSHAALAADLAKMLAVYLTPGETK